MRSRGVGRFGAALLLAGGVAAAAAGACEAETGPAPFVSLPPRTAAATPAPVARLGPTRQPPLDVSLTPPLGFTGHHRVVYGVRSSAGCSGTTRFRVYVVPAHGTPRHVRALDFGPVRVSITTPHGGTEAFAYRYTGSSRRRLDRLLRGGSAVRVWISVRAGDLSAAAPAAAEGLTPRLGGHGR